MIAAAITRVSTIGEDCSVIVRPRDAQRSSLKRELRAAPRISAKASVAASAPMTSTKEFTTPFQNNDQAGAVLSIGSNSSMPVDDANQFSKSVTLSAKPVGCSAALSAGRTQAGLVLPVPVLHSGCRQTARC